MTDTNTYGFDRESIQRVADATRYIESQAPPVTDPRGRSAQWKLRTIRAMITDSDGYGRYDWSEISGLDFTPPGYDPVSNPKPQPGPGVHTNGMSTGRYEGGGQMSGRATDDEGRYDHRGRYAVASDGSTDVLAGTIVTLHPVMGQPYFEFSPPAQDIRLARPRSDYQGPGLVEVELVTAELTTQGDVTIRTEPGIHQGIVPRHCYLDRSGIYLAHKLPVGFAYSRTPPFETMWHLMTDQVFWPHIEGPV